MSLELSDKYKVLYAPYVRASAQVRLTGFRSDSTLSSFAADVGGVPATVTVDRPKWATLREWYI